MRSSADILVLLLSGLISLSLAGYEIFFVANINSSKYEYFVDDRSPVDCSSNNNNTMCEAHTDNLLGGFGGVDSVEKCRELCYNTSDCRYITYFGQDGYPAKESLVLYDL